MNSILQVAMIIAIAFYFICLFTLLRKNKVTLKYILLWFVTGIIMLFIAIFPTLLETPLHWLGIVEFTNGLFAVIFFFLIIIVMSLTTILSDIIEKKRDMAQKMAIYEYKLRQLEERGESQ